MFCLDWNFVIIQVTSCAVYGSQNLERLFPHPALTDWPLEPRRVFTARYELNL